MIKRLFAIIGMLCASLAAQTVQPIVQPVATFVDGVGNPCALCSLYTYAAGTTTPLATFTDSTGGTQQNNPIVLGAAGGPPPNTGIWLTSGTAYKFVLKSATGATIWTTDNVVGGLYLSNTYLPLAGGTLTGALIGTTATFTGLVTGNSFTGAGTGLTGTAASLNIGGTSATATHALNLPADFATQSATAAANANFTSITLSGTMNAIDTESPIGNVTPQGGRFTTITETTKVQLAMPTGNISANTCTTPSVQPMPGVMATSAFVIGYATSPVGVVGWGATGGLVLALWPDSTPANGFDWSVCNQTTSTITAGAISITVGVI